MQNNLWQEQARVYDSRERLANDVTDLLTNSNTQKITDANGQEHEISTGYLNRNGYATQLDGGSKAVQAKMLAMRDSYLEQFKMPQMRAQAARLFDGVVKTGYQQAAAHEADQVRKATGDTFLASAVNESKNATIANTPETLQQSMAHITESYTRYGAYKGMDPESIQKGVEPLYAKAAQNSALNVLRATGDIDAAHAQLDSVRDLIPNDYEKVNQTIDAQHTIIQRNVERADLIKKVDNEFSIISDLATPGAIPPTVLDIDHMSATGGIRNDFAIAYNGAVKAFEKEKDKSVKESIPMSLGVKDSEELDAFGKYIQGVMESEDKDGISKVLTEAMKDSAKGKFSEDKLKITMFYALQRGNMLESAGKMAANPELNKLDGGMKSLMDWQAKSGIQDPQLMKDYVDAWTQSKDAKGAAQVAQQQAVLRADPTVATFDTIPTTIKRSPMTSAVTFPKGTKWTPKAWLKEGTDATQSGK